MKNSLNILILSLSLISCGDSDNTSDSDTSKYICGNSIEDPGEECDDNEDIRCISCKKPRKIFLNIERAFSGSEIGATDLDDFCKLSAEAASIGGNFTWKAWISKEEPIRFNIYNSPGIYMSTVFKPIAYSFEDLVDGSINDAYIVDQFSTLHEENIEIWTGTNQYGEITGTTNCNNWTTDDENKRGTYGRSNKANSEWTNVGFGSCGTDRYIYCIEDLYLSSK